MSRLKSAAGRVSPGWSFGHWPLRRKLAAALALPVILAFVFGGLRVKTDFDAARSLTRAADTVLVLRPIVDYNLAVQHLAAADAIGGGGEIAAITKYESAAANLRIAIKSPSVPEAVKNQAESALALGQSVRSAKTQQSFSGVIIDKSGSTATLLSSAVSNLGLADDSGSAKIVANLQDAISAQRAMTAQQLNLANSDDASSKLRALGSVGAETAALTRLVSNAPADEGTAVRQLLNENGRRYYALQQESLDKNAVAQLGSVIERSNTGYSDLADAQLTNLETTLRDRAATHQKDALVNAGLISIALLAALVIVIGLLRSLLTPIRAVRSGALDIANRRLPAAVTAMRDGEEPPAFEPIPVTTHEEMGQLARAVDDLHSQALALAGEQARLRVQVGHMFETLSRRSTSLIDQQLTLIERLESDEEDPKRLQSLFRLDHLAARMRRNSDSLLVLAGTSTRRGVSGAIAVSDAVRAAVSEVENYERIDIGDTSNDKVLGAVGSDLIHLVAEVVDNALAYSPPTTRVAIRGARTPEGGLLIEVSDHGLGMPPKELAALNDRLANGGDITADTARRMGLFVVGSLAKRHGIAVRLRRNGEDKMGITVSVHLPAGLLADSSTLERQPRPVAKAAPSPAPVEAAPAAPAQPAVGGTTKSGLPTRVRGASGAPSLAGPSPVPGATKKVLPTRTPGAHGPNASTALPAPVKPVIEGAEPPADKAPANGSATNGSATNGAETNGAQPNGAPVNGHAAVDGAGTNGAEVDGSAPADATRGDATPQEAPARAAEAPAAEAPAADAAPEQPAQESAPRLSPSGLPVRRSGATGITAFREFEDTPSVAPEGEQDSPATSSAAPSAAKGSRLMSWLPGRAKAQAEAARLEAEANEPRQMPSNLSAWLDHRAKLVEAAQAREATVDGTTDEDGAEASAATTDGTEAMSATPEAPAAAVEAPETTDMTVPEEWVAEALADEQVAELLAPEAAPAAPEPQEQEPVAREDDGPHDGDDESHAQSAEQPVADATVAEAAVAETATEAPSADTGEALPTRVPGATGSAVADQAQPESDEAAGPRTRRPAVRAHSSSFFGARRRGPAEAAAQDAPAPEATPVAQAEQPQAEVVQPEPEQSEPEFVEPVAEDVQPEPELTEPVAEDVQPEPELSEPELVEPVAEVVETEPVEEQPAQPVAQDASSDGEPAQAGPLNDTPIFRAMMSNWLTDGSAQPAADNWSPTEADQAWSAAARIEEQQPVQESSAGLPMRRPGSNLIPGAMDAAAPAPAPETPTVTPTGSRRDPETIRRNLNRHKNGVSAARTEAQDGTHREEADVHH